MSWSKAKMRGSLVLVPIKNATENILYKYQALSTETYTKTGILITCCKQKFPH